MKRIDIIYEELIKLNNEQGLSATELADCLSFDRANVSSDLNKLWKDGKVHKSEGRPVLFTAISYATKSAKSTLDQLMQENSSLTAAIEQGKAAIIYPPIGMHCLILGETGVGKSMFAGLIHKYAIESKKKKEEAPFITFNCADYANNPQLLLGQLFGVKKGAYTGALEQKGLIEKADGGILFLDEVHRLPAEGQEMLFTFIDKGTLRRLGETDAERTAKVLLLAATTEEPDSSLLKTFTRRIPMVIKLPPLRERTMEERHHLICNFFKEEALRIGKEIYVSANSVQAFLYYHCHNNIGQLKSDIQLACAKAYADLMTNKKEKVKINSSDLPGYVKEGLLTENKNKQFIDVQYDYFIFDPIKEDLIYEFEQHTDRQNIYENIERKFLELKERGLNNDELEQLMNIDIDKYFSQYIEGVNQRINKEDLAKVIDPIVIDLAEKIVQYVDDQLGKALNKKLIPGLALHIQTSISRIENGKKIINPQLNKVRKAYNKEFNLALDCIKMIEECMGIDLPIDEAAFLTMFFVLDNDMIDKEEERVEVLVVTHGSGGATSMADVTNQLLGSNHAKAIDMPIHLGPQEIFQKVKTFAKNRVSQKGLLLLVDMGSLVKFGNMLEKEIGIPVRVVSMVSTLHVIEATRKAIIGYSLEDLFQDVKNLTPFYTEEVENSNIQPQKWAIVTACLTGEGSAVVMKKMLENYLNFNEQALEITPVVFADEKQMVRILTDIKKNSKILAIVSNFPIRENVPQFNVEEVLNLKAVKMMQDIIDIEETFLKMGETLQHHLNHIDGKKLITEIRRSLDQIQRKVSFTINVHDLTGVVLHTSCMIDRLVAGDYSVKFKEKEKVISENNFLYQSVKEALSDLESKYKIVIPDDELCFMMNFFDISQHNQTTY
ncbi:sigma-54-dependent transcriptional regulator [Bacillus sp. CECT 9360]|uniref:sigma 54-interacting transcriptional regulator n=1 Tax=Bacillus sp. CECT 9360 TaxID=2845821 RepID=UPI001E4A9427|nr:sigma-54-dependent transcriptional regulator [Bacillus sp. CECT 9360]CAH0346470.1 Transcriptional regulatory protein DagR [Bacillus sp. CECT 9360]